VTDHYSRIEKHVEKVEDLDRLHTDPLVSVCITTYNHEDFVADAIEGILMQETNFPYEIIVAEDKSTDGTREVVRDYQQRYPEMIRLRLATENLYSKNKRYPAVGAREAARGRYIAQCEGDDYWTDSVKLQKQKDFLRDYPDCKICYTAAEILDNESGEILQGVRKPDDVRRFYSLEYVLRKNPFSLATAFYRREVCNEYPPWFYVGLNGDYCLLVLCALKGEVGYIDEKCAVHRRHGGGVHSPLDILVKYDEAVATRKAILSGLEPHHRRILEATIYSFNRSGLMVAIDRANTSEVRKYARRCWTMVERSSQKCIDVPLLGFLAFYHPVMSPLLRVLRQWRRKLLGFSGASIL
jgi:glycosyltransferase involved in cell wall biosynthesis